MLLSSAWGRRSFPQVLLAAATLAMLQRRPSGASAAGADNILEDLLQYEVVHPSRVDASGRFLSEEVSHRVSRHRRRDSSSGGPRLAQVFYQLQYGGTDLHFNLTLNPHLLGPGFLTERRSGGLRGATVRNHGNTFCHFLGEVQGSEGRRGRAAISTCDGLTGLFKLSDDEFFIRPLAGGEDPGEPQSHVVYKRHTQRPAGLGVQSLQAGARANGTCGLADSSVGIEEQRDAWERRRHRRRIRHRSISREKWVETLVVADPKMVEYHGREGVETYVLAVMNIVAGLFRDASIGNSINIVVVRLILLEQDEEELKISHHADNSLNSFCKWQKQLNLKGDDHSVHHDVAVLLTRKDICAGINKPCETLGLSHVAGMCQPHRSCSISEDTGLPLAYTVAHELGHNFGIQHDGSSNDCEPIGKRPFIMSPQLLYGTSPPNWSRCSRQYITRFLDRGWGWCLDDAPSSSPLTMHPVPSGVLYSATHQCRLQYGSGSVLCDDVDNVCSTLWCTVGDTCHSKLDGAVEGTKCGEDKWCLEGDCVSVGQLPERVHGGWAVWSEWSACSRTCGVGVQSAQRDCISPVPKHGGKYCLGERRRYRVCNSNLCPDNRPSFRLVQCSHFNTMPYKGSFYKWVQVNNRVNPCELHCRPQNELFTEKMLDAVIDGTQCYEGSSSRDICINGICKNVGCDYKIDSNAVEDRCGVCLGNGSTCETVKKTFEKTEGLGYVDIGLIPEGARDIRIEEVAEAGNFLALRSNDPDKYFLNGGWTIQWNGEYKAAGTVFTYERTGHLENLTSPGPTLEPVWIQLLFQETNPGVRYEYTISRETLAEPDDGIVPDFSWQYGAWTECSATCGTGVQRQIVHCMERTSGIVEEHYCDPATRPDDKRASCNEELCPAIWWVGEWQKCSASCGDKGLTKRTVLCIQNVRLEEQRALQPSECQHMPRPEPVTRCNTDVPCPADWTTGNWSECSVTCGGGLRNRVVTCSYNTGVNCDPRQKPSPDLPCYIQDCPTFVDVFDWSGSGASSKEVFNDINAIPEDNQLHKPSQGTTKAQPKDHNPNKVIEDVSLHNHIDNGDAFVKNKVHVDDFYYDYNFIRFHENLAYDFDDESESNQVTNLKNGPSPTLSTEKTTSDDAQTVNTTNMPVSTSLKPVNIAEPRSSKESFMTTDEPEMENKDFLGEELKDEDEQRVPYFEDGFLPVVTTITPHAPNTRFAQRLKDLLNKHNRNQQTSKSKAKEHEGNKLLSNNGMDLATGNVEDQIGEDYGKGYVTPHHEDNDGHFSFSPTGTSVDHSITQSKRYSAREETTVSPHEIHKDWTSQELFEKTLPSLPTANLFDIDLPLGSQLLHEAPLQTTALAFEVKSPIPKIHKDSDSSHLGVKDFDYYSARSTAEDESTHLQPFDGDYVVTSMLPSQVALSAPAPSATSHLAIGIEASKDQVVISTATAFVPRTSLEHSLHSMPVETPLTLSVPEFTGGVPVRSSADTSKTETPTSLWSEMDYNNIYIPPTLKNHVPEQHGEMNRSLLHDNSSPNGTTSPSIIPATQLDINAYWKIGNWSICSTSCGLGAIWRSVVCSTGRDTDCVTSKKPVVACHCNLRPCSAWRVGEWSKCSRNCGGGAMLREIQCFDMRNQRSLRPFHCQVVTPSPAFRAPCNPQSCVDWYTSSWGQCSEICGGGEQQRLVTCPETGRCDETLEPNSIQVCNSQPCAQWVTGSWGQCSASCGGGVRRRLVKCMNTKAEAGQEQVEEDTSQCEQAAWPESIQKCNLQECRAPPSQLCTRDRLTFRFCQTLLWLGRCQLATVRSQCCKTCGQPPRGNERMS